MFFSNLLNKIYRNTSIQQKLLIVIFTVCIPSTIILISALSLHDYKGLKKQVEQDLIITAEITSDRLAAAVAFKDRENANLILEALNKNHSIKAACLFDQEKQLFAFYVSESLNKNVCSEYAHIASENELKFKKLKVEINYKDLKSLGDLVVYASLAEVAKFATRQLIFVAISTLIVLFLISLPLAFFIQKTISSPIYELLETGKAISRIPSAKLKEFSTQDEVALSIKLWEEIRSLCESYFTSIEATETMINSQESFLETLDKTLKHHKGVHLSLERNIHQAAYSEIVEIAEHSLSMRSFLSLEFESLIKLFYELHLEESAILRKENKEDFSYEDLEIYVEQTIKKSINSYQNIIFKNAVTAWKVHAYRSALYKTIESALEAFYFAQFPPLQYEIIIQPKFSGFLEISFILKCTAIGHNLDSFDTYNNHFQHALIKLRHFSNINNPHHSSLQVTDHEQSLELVIRV